ncbi:hypothetical protein EJB05_09265, partial [Eragrostis curvula]
MAFYKYGLTFLAGTGFGAVMTSIRRDTCTLSKQHCRHRRCRHDVARDEDQLPETTGERYDEYGPRKAKESDMGTSKPPKKGSGKAKKRDMEESD